MRKAWQNYGLGVFYVVGWLATWALHAFYTWHNDAFFPHDAVPWAYRWLETTFENLQSEMWQIGLFIVATKYLYFKGSHESKPPGTPPEEQGP